MAASSNFPSLIPALTSAVSIHGDLYLAPGGLGNNIEGTSWPDFTSSVLLTLGQSSVISHSRWGRLPPMPTEVTHSQAGVRAVSFNSFSADTPGAFLLFFPETGFKAHLHKGSCLTESLDDGVSIYTLSNTGHTGLQWFYIGRRRVVVSHSF